MRRYSGSRFQRVVKFFGRLIWPSAWNMDLPRAQTPDEIAIEYWASRRDIMLRGCCCPTMDCGRCICCKAKWRHRTR